VYIQNVGEQER